MVALAVLITCALIAAPLAGQDDRLREDWASLARYREANEQLGPPRPGEERVVFYGNSITDAWARYFDTMFPNKPYVGRGISGQTTPQMLVRFRQDVIALEPAVVVILAGTNDIAGNTGPSTQAMIEDNLISMVELAKANGISVVLSSVLPAYGQHTTWCTWITTQRWLTVARVCGPSCRKMVCTPTRRAIA
jgi:lysophospholipase L1-like esterase